MSSIQEHVHYNIDMKWLTSSMQWDLSHGLNEWKKFGSPDTMLVSTDVQRRFCGFLMAKVWILEELTEPLLVNPAPQQAVCVHV